MRLFRRLAQLTVAILILSGSLVITPRPAQADTSCPPLTFCIWNDVNYQGSRRLFSLANVLCVTYSGTFVPRSFKNNSPSDWTIYDGVNCTYISAAYDVGPGEYNPNISDVVWESMNLSIVP